MKLIRQIKVACILLLFFTFVCGFLYTMTITLFASVIFPTQSQGSVIHATSKKGETIDFGSELLGQEFKNPNYFISRPQKVSNLSPVSSDFSNIIAERKAFFKKIDPDNTKPIPSDLVYASGSGFDAYISLEAANYQVERIARLRSMDIKKVKDMIKKYTISPFIGNYSGELVHVLYLNLELDGYKID